MPGWSWDTMSRFGLGLASELRDTSRIDFRDEYRVEPVCGKYSTTPTQAQVQLPYF